ncbi:hypothetical protein FOC4_g10006613 [Fusarium odoratissimum]|uniref:Uncharacterized protein n=1 Tax=Fusarium oxysporum f. sp. cubense (strain race 4) TaxID=2502994 RepID=N1RKJ9_FUSC4|nr:hypothetical protein FOC4_g10006613 [Fusarium odoratissimum]
MSQFVGFSWTTPFSFIKSFREESPRSKYINDLMERIPFNTTSTPGNDYNNLRYRRTLTVTNSWNIMGCLTEVLSNWKRLHEFLELADHVNQLAFVFNSVNQAELYLDRMFRL